jgi:hypothetical protein
MTLFQQPAKRRTQTPAGGSNGCPQGKPVELETLYQFQKNKSTSQSDFCKNK